MKKSNLFNKLLIILVVGLPNSFAYATEGKGTYSYENDNVETTFKFEGMDNNSCLRATISFEEENSGGSHRTTLCPVSYKTNAVSGNRKSDVIFYVDHQTIEENGSVRSHYAITENDARRMPQRIRLYLAHRSPIPSERGIEFSDITLKKK